MDEQVIVREILESYEDITIEKQILDNMFMFILFGKKFLLIAPKADDVKAKSDIYLYDDEGFDFPHVMLWEEEIKDNSNLPSGKYRWICLYENGSIVNSIISFEDKIIDAIERLIKLLSMNEKDREKEFQREFLLYWNSVSMIQSATVYLGQEKRFAKMEVYCCKKETRYVETGLYLSDLNIIEKGKRKWQQHIENDVFFIPITDRRGILPPHRGYKWTVNNICEIIYGKQIDHVSFDTFQCIKNERVSTQNIILVFGMKVEQSQVTFAVKIKCRNTTGRTLMEKICEDALSIDPIFTKREDYLYLSNQIGNDIGLHGKKVLLVGAGSLGSYVGFELVKNGVSTLTVYDGEKLVPENIMRWAYGGFGKEMNKANLIKLLLELLNPEIQVKAVPANIDEKAIVEELNLVDVIVFTIGSSDSQLRFNQLLKRVGCHIPVIYSWLEAGGKFSHILAIEYDKEGCYQCLFTAADGSLVNNKANINDDDTDDVNIMRNGCGGTRAAYGTAVVLRTTATLLDTIQELLSGKKESNTLINITPEKIVYPAHIIPNKECRCCGYRN